MTPAATAKSDAPPSDPIRDALGNPSVLARMASHALSTLGKYRRDLAQTMRQTLAEDAVQETSRRSLQLASKFDPSRGDIGAWLHGILTNVLREKPRGSGTPPARPPETAGFLEELVYPGAGPSEEVAARLDAASYLAHLSEEHRTILRLRLVEDLSHEEIGERRGISAGLSRLQYYRALGAAKVAAGATPKEGGR